MIDVKSRTGKYSYIPVIVGPTASGKSDLAMRIAEETGGEIVSCDSMQIYRGLDIGTAKPTAADQERVRHHMIDIADPDQKYSVSDFVRDAPAEINSILDDGKLPVLCGGTGQYISAMVKGYEFGDSNTESDNTELLWERFRSEGIDGIYSELEKIDPEAAQKIHPNNTRRVIRAYSVYLDTGITFTEKNRTSVVSGAQYPFKMFQIGWERSLLYDRINLRVDKMIEMGLVEEAQWLLANYEQKGATALQAIGYKELFPYLKGEISLDRAIYDIKLNSRHYAKRQLTWFRYMSEINIVTPENDITEFII